MPSRDFSRSSLLVPEPLCRPLPLAAPAGSVIPVVRLALQTSRGGSIKETFYECKSKFLRRRITALNPWREERESDEKPGLELVAGDATGLVATEVRREGELDQVGEQVA